MLEQDGMPAGRLADSLPGQQLACQRVAQWQKSSDLTKALPAELFSSVTTPNRSQVLLISELVVTCVRASRSHVQHASHPGFRVALIRRCDELYVGGSRGSHYIGPVAYDVADQDAEQAACDDQQARGLQGVGEAGRFEWFACHWDPPALVGAISDLGAVTRLGDVPG